MIRKGQMNKERNSKRGKARRMGKRYRNGKGKKEKESGPHRAHA